MRKNLVLLIIVVGIMTSCTFIPPCAWNTAGGQDCDRVHNHD